MLLGHGYRPGMWADRACAEGQTFYLKSRQEGGCPGDVVDGSMWVLCDGMSGQHGYRTTLVVARDARGYYWTLSSLYSSGQSRWFLSRPAQRQGLGGGWGAAGACKTEVELSARCYRAGLDWAGCHLGGLQLLIGGVRSVCRHLGTRVREVLMRTVEGRGSTPEFAKVHDSTQSISRQ